MQFIVNDLGTYDDLKEVKPGRDDGYIEQCLKSLFEEGGDDGFVILADEDKEPGNEGYYMQVAYNGRDKGFVLEYQDGSVDEHYQCLTISLGAQGLQEVTQAFLSYLHATEEWKTSIESKTIELETIERETISEWQEGISGEAKKGLAWIIIGIVCGLAVIDLGWRAITDWDGLMADLFSTYLLLWVLAIMGLPIWVVILLWNKK